MMLRIPAQQLLLNMGTYALGPVHISHKLCLCGQVTVGCSKHQQVSAAYALMSCASECCTGQGN